MDCSPPGSSVHGILQAGILEWVAIPPPGDLPNPGIKPTCSALLADSLLSELQASLAEIKCVLTNCLKKITLGTFVVVQWLRFGVINEVKWLSRVRLCDPMDSATPWTVAYQAPPMGFSRQE